MKARRALGALAGVAVALALAPAALAGGPGKWTKISSGTVSGLSDAGIARTPDGNLHVVWQKGEGGGKFGIGWSTISQSGKLLASGTAGSVTGWVAIDGTPKLVPLGSGVRLVFIGGQDTNPSNFFSRGSVYTETSPDGAAWTLVGGTLMQHTTLNAGLAATAEPDGTPVAASGLNNTLYYHEGIDPSSPAASADGSITQPAFGLESPTLATNADGTVWLAWYRYSGDANQGYWVTRILPTLGSPMKAPNSGIAAIGNEPGQGVALAARQGGGLYMAYCSPTASKKCAKVELWQVGAPKARVVPGSGTGGAGHVALTPGLGGRLWVLWFDATKNVIRATRTNTAATAFGPVRTLKPPKKTFIFNRLQADGSLGRADVVANVLLDAPGNPVDLWHTQILPGLKLKAKPKRFSHKRAATVAFSVTDAGQPVAGAKVSCLGEKAKTKANGVAKLHFKKGEPVGKHIARAHKKGLAPAKTTVKTT